MPGSAFSGAPIAGPPTGAPVASSAFRTSGPLISFFATATGGLKEFFWLEYMVEYTDCDLQPVKPTTEMRASARIERVDMQVGVNESASARQPPSRLRICYHLVLRVLAARVRTNFPAS